MKMLTAKEEEIMGYFWEKGPLFVKQLLDFYDGIKEQIDTITNSYNKWLYLFHISSC